MERSWADPSEDWHWPLARRKPGCTAGRKWRVRTEASSAVPHLLHYCLTPLSTPTRPPPRKNCLPWNQSLALERSGAAALEDLPKSGALSPQEGQISWRWPPFVGGGLPHVRAERWKGLWGDLWASVPLPVGSFYLRAGPPPVGAQHRLTGRLCRFFQSPSAAASSSSSSSSRSSPDS